MTLISKSSPPLFLLGFYVFLLFFFFFFNVLKFTNLSFLSGHNRNMKEIAKFRGCEDLWEVAKLHNRESSFPAVLVNENELLIYQKLHLISSSEYFSF